MPNHPVPWSKPFCFPYSCCFKVVKPLLNHVESCAIHMFGQSSLPSPWFSSDVSPHVSAVSKRCEALASGHRGAGHAGCFVRRGNQMLAVKLTYDGAPLGLFGGRWDPLGELLMGFWMGFWIVLQQNVWFYQILSRTNDDDLFRHWNDGVMMGRAY